MPDVKKTPPMMAFAVAMANMMGWTVFPLRAIINGVCSCGDVDCKAIGKHPHTKWRADPNGASNDPERVRGLWERNPNDGIGLVTGEKSNVWVLDVDLRNGGVANLAELQKIHGPLPRTVQAATGSQGVHYYFNNPGPDYRDTANVLAKGLDTRGDGGMVVAPPSLHKSGRRYSWVYGPSMTELADVPEWILEFLIKKCPPRPVHAKKTRQVGAHRAKMDIDDARELLSTMVESVLVNWMIANPNDVDRETWRGVAQNLACAVIDFPELLEEARAAFHVISREYEKYKKSETEAVFQDSVNVVKNQGPMSFAHMESCGLSDEFHAPGIVNMIQDARYRLQQKLEKQRDHR